MGAALQQVRTRQPQQERVHHQPLQQSTPARSVTEAPGEEEHLERLGNAERCDAVGLQGDGGQASGPPPGTMAACRELAATEPGQIAAADFGVSLQEAEEILLSLGEQAVESMAAFEDASGRWYHLGEGREQYERERALYVHDLRLYQALGLQARADGAIVESVYRVVDEALLESRATQLLLTGQNLAGESQHGALMLDPEDMDRDLELMEEAFAISGFAATEDAVLAELDERPAELLARLEVEVHGFGAALAQMRARGVARKVDAVGEERQRVEQVIATCDRLGEVLRLCAASYRLGLAGTGAKLEDGGDDLMEITGKPHSIPGAVARAFYEAELHALTARLTALSVAEEGWQEEAHNEAIRDALGEYALAVRAIDEHEQSARDQRDEYTARLGNLGRTMALSAALQGRGLAGDVGQAMENLARIHATHRSLVAVGPPLEDAMARALGTRRILGAAALERPPQAALVGLRERLGGPAHFYDSVYWGLHALQEQVGRQRGSLEVVSERFADILQRQRR